VSIGLYLLRDESVRLTAEVRSCAGGDLLRLALAHHFATKPADWQLGRAASGARIVVAGPRPAVALSLAHTDDLLLAAIADDYSDGNGETGAVGVDIERLRPRRYAAIARHLGWPASLWAQHGTPTEDEFLHLWTLWEALFKSLPQATFSAVRGAFANQAGHVQAGVPGPVGTDLWSGHSWQCSGRCWLSVVVQSVRPPAVRLLRVDRLAGDVESARIKIITTPESQFHF